MALPTDNTNPGIVNVADQADGLISIDQTIQVSRSYNPGPTVQAADEAFGKGLATNIRIPERTL
jgi:hypothetical protein